VSRLKSEQPTFTMRVRPNALVPADAYGEERLDTYRHDSLVEVTMRQDKSPKLLKKYWAILALAVRDCKTPWKRADEANRALKRAFGIMRTGHLTDGREIEEVGSLTQLEGPDFELFFEGAMALLYRITGVDPDTLWKESAGPALEVEYESSAAAPSLPADEGDGSSPAPLNPPRPSSPAVAASQSAPQTSRGADGGSGAGTRDPTPAAPPRPTPAPQRRIDPSTKLNEPGRELPPIQRHENIVGSIEADERALLAAAQPMNTRELKQEAIQKVLDLALDEALTAQERTEELAKNREIWVAKMPGHPEFIKTVFETAAKVMRKELPRPAAQKYLFGLKDG
jgi:hypothetical protein